MLNKIKNYFSYRLYLFRNNGLYTFKIFKLAHYFISKILIKIIAKKYFFFIDLNNDHPKLYNSISQSYEKYKKLQIRANLIKLNRIWVKEPDIKLISEIIFKKLKKKNIFGLCQGTRNGAEIIYFKKYIKNLKIIGTDISSSAKNYENTIQWDFNKYNSKFSKKFDFVYSNSHDHSFNLKKTIMIWLKYLKNDGYLILQNHKSNGSLHANNLDISSLETELLPFLILQWTNGKYKVEFFIKPKSSDSSRDKIFFINKN